MFIYNELLIFSALVGIYIYIYIFIIRSVRSITFKSVLFSESGEDWTEGGTCTLFGTNSERVWCASGWQDIGPRFGARLEQICDEFTVPLSCH